MVAFDGEESHHSCGRERGECLSPCGAEFPRLSGSVAWRGGKERIIFCVCVGEMHPSPHAHTQITVACASGTANLRNARGNLHEWDRNSHGDSRKSGAVNVCDAHASGARNAHKACGAANIRNACTSGATNAHGDTRASCAAPACTRSH